VEKRSSQRTQTLLKARAICQPNETPVECLIVDVSATGARLQFGNGGITTLPERFELLIMKTGERPVVRVAWRNIGEMGVRFETHVPLGAGQPDLPRR
jgi:PilZ domain